MSPPPLQSPAEVVAFVAGIFERRGAEAYLGEAVTMSEHMRQAAHAAELAGAPAALVAGALLHDVGHFTSEFGDDALERGIDNRHDAAGARVLEPWFPAPVVACIRHHVAAKRYLCRVDPAYMATLSDASVHSLGLQGGPMSADEARAFSALPGLDDIVRVRRWDDAGKRLGARVPPFAHYAPLLEGLVAARLGTAS